MPGFCQIARFFLACQALPASSATPCWHQAAAAAAALNAMARHHHARMEG